MDKVGIHLHSSARSERLDLAFSLLFSSWLDNRENAIKNLGFASLSFLFERTNTCGFRKRCERFRNVKLTTDTDTGVNHVRQHPHHRPGSQAVQAPSGHDLDRAGSLGSGVFLA